MTMGDDVNELMIVVAGYAEAFASDKAAEEKDRQSMCVKCADMTCYILHLTGYGKHSHCPPATILTTTCGRIWIQPGCRPLQPISFRGAQGCRCREDAWGSKWLHTAGCAGLAWPALLIPVPLPHHPLCCIRHPRPSFHTSLFSLGHPL